MSRHTSNVIPFPNSRVHQPPSAPKPSGRQKRLAALEEATSRGVARSLAIPQAMAMGASTPDALPDPAIVARSGFGVIDHVGRAICHEGTSAPQEGWGLFEHGALGRHDPSGFADWLTVAP